MSHLPYDNSSRNTSQEKIQTLNTKPNKASNTSSAPYSLPDHLGCRDLHYDVPERDIFGRG